MWPNLLSDITAIIADFKTLSAGTAITNVSDILTRAGDAVKQIGTLWGSIFGMSAVPCKTPVPVTKAEADAACAELEKFCSGMHGTVSVSSVGAINFANLLKLLQFIISFLQTQQTP